MRNKTIITACVIAILLFGVRLFFPSIFLRGTDSAAALFAPLAVGQSAEPVPSPGFVSVRIIAKPPETIFDTFILSVDTANTTIGQTVYLASGSDESIAVGKIVSIEGSYVHALLFTSSGQTEAATVSRTGATVTLQGIGGGTFSVRVPKDFDIQAGDILTDEDSGAVIAQVYSVGVAGADSFKQVLARIPGNIFAAQYLELKLQPAD